MACMGEMVEILLFDAKTHLYVVSHKFEFLIWKLVDQYINLYVFRMFVESLMTFYTTFNNYAYFVTDKFVYSICSLQAIATRSMFE